MRDGLGLDLVELEEEVDNVKYDDERSTLEKLLLSSSSSLWELYLGSCVLELLGANVAPAGLPFMLNSLVYDGSDAETVLKYLDTPTCLDGSLKELEMCIEQGRVLSSNEERDIIIELMRFPRASPDAELCYSPHSD
ncbi:hypothetical protein P3S68_017638 [Capsicum galapagoense]